MSSGPEIGALYHEFFLRDKPHLTAQMFCKNARSKLAMNDDSTPAPTHTSSSTAPTTAANSSNSSCNGNAAMKAAPRPGSPLLSGSGHNSGLHPQFMLPQAQLSTSLHGLHEAPQQQYTLPPDIPLSLLEMLSKGGPTSSSSDLTSMSALAGASSASGPVPSRLLQQSQYANLLLERQIQILQQEQAKLLMMRQAAARRQQQQQQAQQQQQLFQHDQQQLRHQLHALGMQQNHPQHLQGLDLSSTLLMGGGGGGLAVSELPLGVPSSPSETAAAALVAAVAASGGSSSTSAADATAAALELLQRDEEDRLCQLINLKMKQDMSTNKKGTQPTNHRASAA